LRSSPEIIEGYYAKLKPEKLDLEYIAFTKLRVELTSGYYNTIGDQLSKIKGSKQLH